MNKLFKTKDGRDIIHSHNNFKGETTFMACDKNGDIKPHYKAVTKSNCFFDWDEPLTEEEIEYISSN